MELDGEPISIEQSSPSDRSTGLNQREDYPFFNNSFNNADGINKSDSEGRIPMVVASAAQNTPNYFDQDNFYPANGQNVFQSAGSNIKSFFGKDAASERRTSRKERKSAKSAEIQSRAELNKSVGQEKASDVELAKALGSSKSTGMSTTTKVLIGVGVLAVAGTIIYFVTKKK